MNGLLRLVINFKLRERSLAAFGSLTANMPVWLAWIAALKKFRTIRMWLGENGDPYVGIAMWPSLSIYEKAVWRRCMTFHPPPFPLSLLRSPTPVNLTLSSHGQVERELSWWNRVGTETRIQKITPIPLNHFAVSTACSTPLVSSVLPRQKRLSKDYLLRLFRDE